MKKYAEGIGCLVGALVGCIIAGVAVYYTSSIWCCLIVPAGYLSGSKIGETIENSGKTPDV